MSSFDRPPRARQHCRHYSYETGLKGRGPLCALGIDLSGHGTAMACMPPGEYKRGVCDRRSDWSDAERDAWDKFVGESTARLILAVAALPAPIPINTSGKVQCPNCKGQLHYARWHRGAEIQCTTPNCCGPVHYSIAAGADWPQGSAKERT